MFQNNLNPTSVPVLIVGGGITGLSAALFLQAQGTPFILVERHHGTAVQPKSRTIDIRTMELFRELGLADILRQAGKAMAPSWGILHGHNLVDTLNNRATDTGITVKRPDQLPEMKCWATQSPESVCRCTQDISEAVLYQSAVERGGDLRFYHEMTSFTEHGQQVTVMIRNRETGQEQQITADYLIAADGANSPVRSTLNIATSGAGTLASFLNIYFEADLSKMVSGREFSQFLIREPDLTGYLLSINNSNRWAFHLKFYPENGKRPEDYPQQRINMVLQRVLGLPGLPVRILHVLPWQLSVNIAEQIQYGRIFLAGDAAHTMTPYAGKGASTGVQDAHNLAWKLNAVIKDYADQKLLATYQTERQPVGAFYARLSGSLTAPDGLIDDKGLLQQGASLFGLPNYLYNSDAIVGGPASDKEARYFTGQPGTRLPHLWLDEQQLQSTLDWIKGEMILVVTGDQHQKEAVCKQFDKEIGMQLPVYGFTQDHHLSAWQQLTLTQPGDVLLIRPDGFIACRLSSTDLDTFLAIHVKTILQKQ